MSLSTGPKRMMWIDLLLPLPRTVASTGVWFLMGVERAGGFYHKSALSSFEPREFRAPHLVEMTTV